MTAENDDKTSHELEPGTQDHGAPNPTAENASNQAGGVHEPSNVAGEEDMAAPPGIAGYIPPMHFVVVALLVAGILLGIFLLLITVLRDTVDKYLAYMVLLATFSVLFSALFGATGRFKNAYGVLTGSAAIFVIMCLALLGVVKVFHPIEDLESKRDAIEKEKVELENKLKQICGDLSVLDYSYKTTAQKPTHETTTESWRVVVVRCERIVQALVARKELAISLQLNTGDAWAEPGTKVEVKNYRQNWIQVEPTGKEYRIPLDLFPGEILIDRKYKICFHDGLPRLEIPYDPRIARGSFIYSEEGASAQNLPAPYDRW